MMNESGTKQEIPMSFNLDDFYTTQEQRDDLLSAEDTLLEIMNEMDAVMKEEFATIFEKIREEFKHVFKELFKGA